MYMQLSASYTNTPSLWPDIVFYPTLHKIPFWSCAQIDFLIIAQVASLYMLALHMLTQESLQPGK